MKRFLRNEERDLLAAMIKMKPQAKGLLFSLDEMVVEEMADGGMGSLQLCRIGKDMPRHLGSLLIEREFIDIDGVPIMVAINLDEEGELFELDIWKVDFSQVKRFPSVIFDVST